VPVTVVAGAQTKDSVGVVCQGPLRNAVVFGDVRSQLLSVNADGTDLQQMTHDNLTYGSVAVSPDGREIAAVAYLGSSINGWLLVMRNDGTGAHALVATGAPVDQVVWAPDGRIAFAQPQAPASSPFPDLCFIQPDGTDRACVAIENGHVFFSEFALSPDGTQVVYASGGIQIMNADGTNWHVVNTAGENHGVDWSPDGTRIAYQHIEDLDSDGVPEAEIYTINVDGSDPVRLTNDQVTDGFPRWSPDGSRILYRSESEPGGQPVLKIMDADGSNSHKLLADGTAASPGTWSPLP
jgi:TolB protein